MRNALPILGLVILGACAAPEPVLDRPIAQTGEPLRVLPSGAELADVRADLLTTARTKFGEAAVTRALASPTHLVVKRFAGMVPPPPPGAGADWMPPTPSALLMKASSGWQTATATGWRPVSATAAAELDALLASSRFWSEGSILPCPDFGASNLLLKMPGHDETVRRALCSSATADIVSAALNG